MLAIEREVLGETSDDAIGARASRLDSGAAHGRPAAVAAGHNVLKLRMSALGEAHWKVADADGRCKISNDGLQ